MPLDMRYIFRPSLSPEPLGKTRSEAGFPQAVTSDGGPEYGRSKRDDRPRPAAAILRTANFAFARGPILCVEPIVNANVNNLH